MFLCFLCFLFLKKILYSKMEKSSRPIRNRRHSRFVDICERFSFSFSFFIIVHGVRFIVLFVFILFKDFYFYLFLKSRGNLSIFFYRIYSHFFFTTVEMIYKIFKNVIIM